MEEFYSVLEVSCDLNIDYNCWEQDIVKLDEGETKAQAFSFLEKLGWFFPKGEHICPYCANGVTREEISEDTLKLIK